MAYIICELWACREWSTQCKRGIVPLWLVCFFNVTSSLCCLIPRRCMHTSTYIRLFQMRVKTSSYDQCSAKIVPTQNFWHENILVQNKANCGMCDLKYDWSHCPHVLRCLWPLIVATPTAQQTVAVSLRHNRGKVRVSPLLLLQWSQWIDHTHAQCVKLFHSSICVNHDSTKTSTIYCLRRQSARQKFIFAQIWKHTHQEKQQLIQPQMIAQLHVQPTKHNQAMDN